MFNHAADPAKSEAPILSKLDRDSGADKNCVSLTRMRAIRCHQLIGPTGLRVDELPDPAPGLGEVAIDVRAAALNFPDVLRSYGKYQFKPPPPFIPGGEAAGVVYAVGSDVTSVAPGDRVAATTVYGAFAERILVQASATIPLPDAVSFEVGAA